ncbi:MAG: DUF2142 domain-containing protein [Lachnospiraceae bacterium]
MKNRSNIRNVRPIVWIGLVLLIVLAVLHLLDTRAGAIESGDLWLTGRYLAVTSVAILTVLLCGVGLLWPDLNAKVRLETVYVVAAVLFGLLYLYVLPPLSAPDEMRHYISAYRLSNQIMGVPGMGEDGKVIIREEDWFMEDPKRSYQAYITADGELATDADGAEGAEILGQILTEETYRLIHGKGLMGWEAPRQEHGSGTVLSNHLPVVTTPCAYVMPAIGISLGRLAGMNSLGLAVMGRLMNLVLFIAGTYLAMKKLPFGREVLFGVALLPMTLHLSASFSYDGFIMVGIFYLTACCLDLACRAERVRARDVLALALIMAITGPCKMVYAVFLGLCLLIPVRKFGGWKRWLLSAVCVSGAWVAAMILVNGQTVASYATETENYITWAQEAGYSLELLIHRPVQTLQMFYRTIVWQAEHYHLTMIGAYLGNVDLVLDVPYLVVILFTAGLLGLALRKPGESLILTGKQRIWVWFLCLVCAGALMFSMLLAWTPLSSKVICGVQGRYFLPFLPLLMISCKNNTIVLTKNADRSILYLMCCANGYILFRLFSIVSMRL